MKKRTWIIIGLVVIVAGAMIGVLNRQGMVSAQSAAVSSPIAQVTRTTMSSAVKTSGSIAANDDVALAFGANGTVVAVGVSKLATRLSKATSWRS
jgi:hypothetical protein